MNRQQFPVAPQGTAPFSYQGAPAYPTTYQGAAPQTTPPMPSGAMIPTGGMATPPAAQPVFEESYIENILRLNLGKMATVYMTFENNSQWNAKIFKGRLEAAGRDHIIISDPATGMRYLLLMINLDYVTFEGELNYEYPGFTSGIGR
ncbi:spore coat protein GerQ [Paenibacillus antri]|uniref:Spore coat protein GerQ n=2 Tax=Paenibacillus antri TaxID=2582848 RepID=A0A5R9GH35_9BACL|nr:spore coat protein GerQ [Paenibacillus antri]